MKKYIAVIALSLCVASLAVCVGNLPADGAKGIPEEEVETTVLAEVPEYPTNL